MSSTSLTIVLSLCLLVSGSYAADVVTPPTIDASSPSQSAAPAEVPTLPDENEADDSRNIPQPEVRIIRKKETTIEEYRVNGRLRYVKITPSSGKPYYMVDMDGDGSVETRYNDLDNPPINQWILMQW